jgi:hypothetical protein
LVVRRVFHMTDTILMKLGFYETLSLVDASYLMIWYMSCGQVIQYPTHIGLLEYCYGNH